MSIALTLALLAVGLILTPLFCRWLGRNAGWPLAAAYLGAAVLYLPALQAGGSAGTGSDSGPAANTWSIPWIPAWGIDLSFAADPISSVFTLISLLIGAVVLAYSTRYLDAGMRPSAYLSFYLGMALFTVSMVGLVTADDLMVLFLCWELTSLASFLLIARSGRSAFAPSMRTLLVTFLGGLALLVAVVLVAVRAGTTDLSEILDPEAAGGLWTSDPAFTTTIGLLIALAAMTKSAQFPFHSWLPDAMAAITPVSAYLHAAAVVKAGIFLLLRFSPAFHDNALWSVLLVTAGLVTALVGGWRALQQHDLKKLMAYSTVSQLGLIVAAIGTGTEAGIAAALIHTIAHALFKSGLFMMVGVVDHATGTRDLRQMPVLRRVLPGTFAVTVLGAGAMAGIPPLLGFVSKESIFTALNAWSTDWVAAGAAAATLPAWAGPAALAGAALGSVLTVAYCAKIVVGGFWDPRRATAPEPAPAASHAHNDDAGHAPGTILVGSTALPILASVAALFALPLLDTAVGAAATAALPGAEVHPHFVLWHGVTPELLTTVAVLAVGLGTLAFRHRLWPALERAELPFSGSGLIESATAALAALGSGVNRLTARDAAASHAAMMVLSLAAIVVPGVLLLNAGGSLPPLQPNLNRASDIVLLILLAVSALGVAMARSRLGATVALSAVGILVTVQIVSLGAPDVALTQLLVESLTVIVIMLVLQKLPRTFRRVRTRRAVPAALISVSAGLATGLAVWGLTGRREKSEVGTYLLENGQDITGGVNIVNVILVEFRALDTLGELAVLGMTGVAIAAILSTIRNRHLDPQLTPATPGEDDGSGAPEGPELGTPTARRAILDSWANTSQLQLMLKVILPILAVVSAILFLRGHNEPGGGFIAALVGSAVVGLLYLSTSKDRQIGPPRAPLFLIGGGVVIAVTIGLVNMAFTGTYMEPQHGYLLGQHVTTSMIFDAGVYLAVIGLVMLAFNVLGTAPASAEQEGGESTRERVDEAFLGEIDTPAPDTQEEAAPVTSSIPVRPQTQHISSGVRPEEWGR
ncbi:DUF4040 family protein [Citricoccus sp.]|uniref:DUF4040 family protein n=1 Tax=Citricoccus sp. TaxID=1978372 RepID=UPI0028BDACA4|nr:DUF4040 family protein [Citricoccus sp.]